MGNWCPTWLLPSFPPNTSDCIDQSLLKSAVLWGQGQVASLFSFEGKEMLLGFPATLRYWAGWPSSSQGEGFLFLSVSREGGWDAVAMSEWDGQVCGAHGNGRGPCASVSWAGFKEQDTEQDREWRVASENGEERKSPVRRGFDQMSVSRVSSLRTGALDCVRLPFPSR